MNIVFPLEESEITSLCPVLGTMHAQMYHGMCPLHLQSPFEKEIQVSFIGGRPFITYDPIGGSAFTVTRLFAKKYGFKPIFLPARAVDVARSNGTTFGMFHRVKNVLVTHHKKEK